ncbi:type VII secretion protein EccB [Actinacidiphila alni]|uniref:Type VII secretion protein EccB n=1 Tax=Actinacidiphila alni TaxID=380248 RepID=A0A1I2J2F4_9ACTN|nr:type VII secretion protein EccB [Actinacidiphila alni]SFF47447.1 type VII secretion protein EccB [Actinacidiphila alni]
MQNRRDQVQAHQFVVSRLTTGLLRADPDSPEVPTRRTHRGLGLGAALGSVVAVGSLVFGFLSPSASSAWRDGRSLVVEKGTGTRYLYDGRLRPVRNYASVRLLLGAAPKSLSVSAKSLAGTPHGPATGIADAPEQLPAAGRLDTGPWEVCAGTRPTDTGERAPLTTVVVDAEDTAGGVAGDRALLVSGPDGAFHLIWHGNRFKLASTRATADALGYGAAKTTPVSASFLDAVPAGPDLAPTSVPDQGEAGPVLDGRQSRVGQIFTVRTPGAAEQYYLLKRSGLRPLSVTAAALALSGPDVREKAYGGGAPTALPLSVDALNSALAPRDTVPDDVQRTEAALPAAPPPLLTIGDETSVCVRLAVDGRNTRIGLVTVASATLGAAAVAPPEATAPACLAVDAVAVPPDGGSLVRVLGSAGGAVGDTTYLVTDQGVKYRLPSAAAARALGYDPARARGLPSPLLGMLPTGPDLSPDDAKAGRARTTGTPACPPAAARTGRTDASAEPGKGGEQIPRILN